MVLTPKEKVIAIVSNGIAVYSLLQERDSLPENTTIYDFIIRVIPEDVRPELNSGLIDEVFEYVSSAHSS